MVSLFDRAGSLARGLRRQPSSKRARRDQDRRLRLAIDQFEKRLALAITTPLSIGGTTVGSFYDAPTGPANVGDLVTVSIEGTSGTVIFNGGKGVADGTDIQTIEILNASPDFQLTFGATITTGTAVPYGSDGVVNLGVITTQNVIRGINTVRGPLTNVASPWEIETSAIHLYTFNEGTVSGTTVTDLIGGADGTLVNGATVVNGQLVLADIGQTGANVQYMQMPVDVIPQGSTALTAELWFTASASTQVWGRGFDFGADTLNYMFFSPVNDTGGSRAAITDSSSDGERRVNGPTVYNDDTQHLATVTIDDATDTLTYYIDGVQVGTVGLADTTLSGLEAINNFLGRAQYEFDPGFVGSMNQFALYDRALNVAEVQANYAAGPISGALTPIGFTQTTPGSGTLELVGDQTTAFPVGAFVCATPLLPSAAAPSFATVDSVAYDSNTNVTTITLAGGATTTAGTTAGALTLAKAVQPEFRLTTFVGKNFSNRSLKDGGGLFVDVVQGGDYTYQGTTIDNLGILLTDGLLAYSTIGIRKQLAATVLLGPSAKASVDGRMFVESATPESLILVGPQNTRTGKNSKFQLTGGTGEFGAGVLVAQAFDGIVNLGGNATGSWIFGRGVGPNAVLNAQSWAGQSSILPFAAAPGVVVAGDFAGTINSTGGDVILSVSRNLTGTARVNGDNDVTLAVGGSIQKGAVVSADSGVTFNVGGSLLGTIQAGSSVMSGAVGGNVSGATLAGSNDITLSVGGGILNSSLAADDEFSLSVAKNVTNSTLTSGDTEISFNVGGNVVNSRFVGGLSGTIAGNVTKSFFLAKAGSLDDEDPEITLDINGSVTDSHVEATSRVSVNVDGNVTKSKFISTTSDVTVDVGGNLRNSQLIAADDGVELTVGRDALGVQVIGDDEDHSIDIGRNFSGTVQNGSGNVTFSVGGSVLKGSSVSAGGDAVVDVGGNFDAATTSRALRFFVDGNVSKASRIVAEVVSNWQDTGTANFGIGGRFDGILNVGLFEAAANSETVKILGNGAGGNARFNVGAFAGAGALVFNGNFNGNMRVLQDLTSNLTFNGNVSRLSFGGRIGSFIPGNTIAPVNVAINVTGRLNYLNSNSYFEATTPGKAGSFWNDSAKATPATGTLSTGSYVTVVPTLQTPTPLPPPTPITYTAPTAPQTYSAKSADPTLGILVTFSAPSSDGGLPVLYYEYSTDATAGTPKWRKFDTASQGPGTDIPLTVDSDGGAWIPGNTYNVAVRAVNAVGATATTSSQVQLIDS